MTDETIDELRRLLARVPLPIQLAGERLKDAEGHTLADTRYVYGYDFERLAVAGLNAMPTLLDELARLRSLAEAAAAYARAETAARSPTRYRPRANLGGSYDPIEVARGEAFQALAEAAAALAPPPAPGGDAGAKGTM